MTTIDRILKHIISIEPQLWSLEESRKFLEAELTAVNGVDELVEYVKKERDNMAEDYPMMFTSYNKILYKLQSLKQTQLVSQKELDDRDNDLANIFNTAKQTGTKWDLFINIMDYLVSKWFLQKWISTEETLKDSQPKEVQQSISREAVEKLREKIKDKQKNDMEEYNNVNTKWIDRAILLAITTIQNTFISQLDALLYIKETSWLI